MASTSRRLRHLARILAGEKAVTAATRRALTVLLKEAARALAASGYDTAVLDNRFPGWRSAVNTDIAPAVEAVFLTAWAATSAGVIDPTLYATRHMEAVNNRLVGVSDDVFDTMRLALEEGRQAGESIPELAGRVDALLTDEQRWTNRAVTVARTEVISANNSGSNQSAFATAEALGIPAGAVARSWLATADGRTRATHADADGQVVFGTQSYDVGGSSLSYPGDPSGAPGEVINCRCTELFLLPGDPDYPAGGGVSSYATSPATLAVVPDATPATRAPVVEPAAVDEGHSSPMEKMARVLSLDELAAEARRGSGEAKRVAKAELRRRGIAAAMASGFWVPEQWAYTRTPQDDENDRQFEGDLMAAMMAPITAAEEAPVTEQTPEAVAPTDPPTHAGIAVQAADSGRVLMLQRSWDEDDAPDVRGTFEFPGGSIDPEDESPEAGAWREWVEETGLPVPAHEVTGGWRSPDGVYQGYIATVPTESAVGPLNPDKDAAHDVNPDDPDRSNPDVTAWFTIEQIKDMGAAVRPVVLTGTDWSQFAPTPAPEEAPVDTDTPDPELEAALTYARQAGYHLVLDAQQGLTAAEEPVVAPESPDVPPVPENETGAPVASDGEPFYGIIWPEGVESGDRRAVEVGATTWRDLPLPIMAQDAQAPGHDGAIRTGRLETLVRDETTYSVPVIRYTGVWDESANATETARQVDRGMVRGISTDGDAVTVELRASDGNTLDPMVDEFPTDGVVVEVATAARISGGTVCSIPAFHQAYIANGRLEDRTDPEPGWNEDGTPKDNVLNPPVAPAEVPDAVAASAWSFSAADPIIMPTDAMSRPDVLDLIPTGTPFTVTETGYVYGHLAVWGTCHIGIEGLCQEPPASASNYANYATGHVFTDDGGKVAVGALVMDTGHAPMHLGARAAAAHYDNTGTAVADVVMGQDHIGIWFAGVVRPGTTPEQVYAMRAAGAVSGDWRNISGDLDLVAALIVNTPGFSVPNASLAASAGMPQAMVAAGMVRTPHPVETITETERVAALVVATLDRRDRARVAASRVNTRLVAARRNRATAATARLSERISAGR